MTIKSESGYISAIIIIRFSSLRLGGERNNGIEKKISSPKNGLS